MAANFDILSARSLKFSHWVRLAKGSPFVRNSVVLFVGTMLANVLNYFFHFAVGRIVPAETYGEIQSLISLLAIVSVPAGTLGMMATKYAAAARAEGSRASGRTVLSYLNRKIAVYGTPLFLAALLCTPFVGSFLKIDRSLPILFLWVLMFLSFFAAVTGGMLSGWQKFGSVNVVSVSSSVVKLVFGIGLALAGLGVGGVVSSFLLAGLAGYVMSWVSLRFLFSDEGPTAQTENVSGSVPLDMDTREIRRYAWPAFAGTLAIIILGNADMVMAKHHLDPAITGEYGALFVVSRTIFFVTGVIASVLFAMSAGQAKDTRHSLKIFRFSAALTALTCLASILVFAAFPGFVMHVLFGAKYIAVSHWLGWFALSASLYAFANLVLQYLLSLHRNRAAEWFLGVAIAELAALYFFGSSFRAILTVVIASQIAAIIAGLFFVSRIARQAALDGSVAPVSPISE